MYFKCCITIIIHPTNNVANCSIFPGLAAGTILYIVVFEVLQREKSKSVPGLLQLAFVLLGFSTMLCIELFGRSITVPGGFEL